MRLVFPVEKILPMWLEYAEQQADDYRIAAASRRNWGDTDIPDMGDRLRSEAEKWDAVASQIRVQLGPDPLEPSLRD